MTEVFFPRLTQEDSDAPGAEGVLATWFVDEGEAVQEGQLIAEVAVDKVDAEVHAPSTGTVTRVVEEGATTTEGTVIARIA